MGEPVLRGSEFIRSKGYVVVGAFVLFVLLVIYWYLYADKLVVKKLSRQDANVAHLPVRVDTATDDRRVVTARTDGSPWAASDRDRAMTRLMDTGGLSGEYGELMRRLHADGGRDEKTRNFAIQHLGHYARERRRLGYIARPPASRETGICAIGVNGRDKRVPPVSCPH